MQGKIQAAVFDVDGTILDTREFISKSFEYALTTLGLPVPDKKFLASHIGPPLEECYKVFAPGVAYEKLAALHHEFQKHNYDLIVPYDGLAELCASLKTMGIRIGVCSSRAVTLIPTLEHAGISNMLDVIVDGSLVTKIGRAHV